MRAAQKLVRKERIAPAAEPGKSNIAQSAWATWRATISMQIEVAALKLFAEHGVDGVSADQIALAAGVSRRTYYRYFESFDDILTAMPHRALQHMSSSFRARPIDEPILESFLAMAESASSVERDVEIHRLAKRVMRRSPEAWMRAMSFMNMKTIEIYRDMIADRLRASGRDPAPASVVAAGLTAIILQVACEAERQQKEPDAVALRRALQSFLDIVGEQRRSPRPAMRSRKKMK